MKRRAFIIHGWDGSPQDDWFPWLKGVLEKKGWEVQVPTMPETNRPEIKAWVEYLTQSVSQPDKNTFLIGHSIGCQAILRYIERLSPNQQIGGVIFVAGWFNLVGLEEAEKPIAKPWLEMPIDFDRVKQHTKKVVAIFSDNDPVVPLSDQKIFADKLNARIIVEHAMGHFNAADGVTKLPACLKAMESIL